MFPVGDDLQGTYLASSYLILGHSSLVNTKQLADIHNQGRFTPDSECNWRDLTIQCISNLVINLYERIWLLQQRNTHAIAVMINKAEFF